MFVNEEIEHRNWQRLKLLIVSRLVILFVFFLVIFFMGSVSPAASVSPVLLHGIYAFIIGVFVLSLFYTLLLRKEKYFRFNVYIQLLIDIGLITFLVYVTGSIGSNYSLLYSLVIIYSAIFLGRRGALVVATFSALAYGLIINLEYLRIIPTSYGTGRDWSVVTGDLVVRIIVHVLSFYVLAFLASIVVEQEKKTRSLLEERESAFDQLDMLFRSIVESVDTGVMTTTLQGRIKTFNRAAQTITGYSLKSVENRLISEVFPDLSGMLNLTDQARVRSRSEVDISNGDRRMVHLGCSLSSLKDRRGKHIGYILIFQDLTEIKQMEDKLEKSKKLALIGEMSAGLAHEMRNPLASITGSIELLGQTANLEETDRRLMQIILRGKEQLEHFVRDFLLLARPLPEKRETVQINAVMDDILEQIKLTGQWPPDIETVKVYDARMDVVANEESIRQIIQNLILNAVQSMEEGGRLTLAVKAVSGDEKRAYAEIQISDTGCGIDEKDMNKVFEPFFTNKDRGTGMGLAIVNRLVDGYGGKISLESKVGQGTRATLWLPVE